MYRCNALGIRRICGEQAIRSNESILPGELILKDESFHFCTSSRRFEKIPKEIRQFSFQQIRITLDSSNERRIPFLIFPKFSFPGLACIEYTHFLIVSLLSEKKRRKRKKKKKKNRETLSQASLSRNSPPRQVCRIVAQPSFSRDYARRVDVIAVERDRQTGRNISPRRNNGRLNTPGSKKIRWNNDRPSVKGQRVPSF